MYYIFTSLCLCNFVSKPCMNGISFNLTSENCDDIFPWAQTYWFVFEGTQLFQKTKSLSKDAAPLQREVHNSKTIVMDAEADPEFYPFPHGIKGHFLMTLLKWAKREEDSFFNVCDNPQLRSA